KSTRIIARSSSMYRPETSSTRRQGGVGSPAHPGCGRIGWRLASRSDAGSSSCRSIPSFDWISELPADRIFFLWVAHDASQAIVLAEVRGGLVIRSEPTRQPHDLEGVNLSCGLQLDTVRHQRTEP